MTSEAWLRRPGCRPTHPRVSVRSWDWANVAVHRRPT